MPVWQATPFLRGRKNQQTTHKVHRPYRKSCSHSSNDCLNQKPASLAERLLDPRPWSGFGDIVVSQHVSDLDKLQPWDVADLHSLGIVPGTLAPELLSRCTVALLHRLAPVTSGSIVFRKDEGHFGRNVQLGVQQQILEVSDVLQRRRMGCRCVTQRQLDVGTIARAHVQDIARDLHSIVQQLHVGWPQRCIQPHNCEPH